MSNVMMQPKQQAQQDAPMHRTPPAGANLTNARGMIAPRGMLVGTADVPGPSFSAPLRRMACTRPRQPC